MIAEYDGSGNMVPKFVYGAGIDEPVSMAIVKKSANINASCSVDITDLRAMARKCI